MTHRLRGMRFRYQVLFAVVLLVGLFFVEYPPIFLLGYWSWGAVVHKTLTGTLIVLNLVIVEFTTRRLGFFRDVAKVKVGRGPKPQPSRAAVEEENEG